MPWNSNGGHYLLVLKLQGIRKLQVGKLGTFTFPPGIYCYVGRARNHLRQRLARHGKKEKPQRWHIDYLLPHTQIEAILLFPLEGLTECNLVQRLVGMGGKPFPPRFGSSDCRCQGHLIFFPWEEGDRWAQLFFHFLAVENPHLPK